jgi:hypothetical protein
MTKPGSKTSHKWSVKTADNSTSTYTKFYLVLLVLITITTVLGLSGFLTIDTTIGYLRTIPALAYINLSQMLITIITAVALIYLYQKKKIGLYIIFGAYALMVVSMLILPFIIQPVIDDTAAQIVAKSSGEVTLDFARSFSRSFFTLVIVLNVISAFIFAFLWNLAWKKQVKRDSDKKLTGN